LADNSHILLVDNYDSFTFNLAGLVAECGFECDVVKNDRVDPHQVEPYRKILISPGPGLPPEAGAVCEIIKKYAATKSILGVCLGHQAIGEAFGAKLGIMGRPEHGVRTKIRVPEDAGDLFAGMPREFEAGVYHSWFVEADSLPACLRVTATAGDGTIMAMSHRDFRVHGVQFHPESVMTPQGIRLMRNWLGSYEL